MVTPYSLQREALVRSVSRDEEELQRALEDLKSVARQEWETTRVRIAATKERLDPKHQIGEQPLVFMGCAFAVGLWLGWSLDF